MLLYTIFIDRRAICNNFDWICQCIASIDLLKKQQELLIWILVYNNRISLGSKSVLKKIPSMKTFLTKLKVFSLKAFHWDFVFLVRKFRICIIQSTCKQLFCCEIWRNFKHTFFAKQLRVATYVFWIINKNCFALVCYIFFSWNLFLFFNKSLTDNSYITINQSYFLK